MNEEFMELESFMEDLRASVGMDLEDFQEESEICNCKTCLFDAVCEQLKKGSNNNSDSECERGGE